MKIMNFLAVLILAWALIFGVHSAHTVGPVKASEQHRENLAGRERMLTQLIAKCACFAALGVDTKGHINQMLTAHTTFEDVLKILKDGSEAEDILPETHANVLEGLEKVATLWAKYSPAIKSFAKNYQGTNVGSQLDKIYTLSLPVLQEMDHTVNVLIADFKQENTFRPGLASALNVSGRQRMLLQKMSKEFCMVASGYKSDEIRKHLIGTVALFESSDTSLMAKLPELKLSKEKSEAFSAQLKKIQVMWSPLHDIFFKVAGGGKPTAEEIKVVATSSQTLLVELDKAVKLYETVR